MILGILGADVITIVELKTQYIAESEMLKILFKKCAIPSFTIR